MDEGQTFSLGWFLLWTKCMRVKHSIWAGFSSGLTEQLQLAPRVGVARTEPETPAVRTPTQCLPGSEPLGHFACLYTHTMSKEEYAPYASRFGLAVFRR